MLETVELTVSAAQRDKLDKFGSQIADTGVNFYVFGAKGEIALRHEGHRFDSEIAWLKNCAETVLAEESEEIKGFGPADNILGARLGIDGQTVGAVIIDCGQSGLFDDEKLHHVCVRQKIDYQFLSESILSARTDVKYLRVSLGILLEDFDTIARSSREVEMVSGELAQTYEELMLLHKMNTRPPGSPVASEKV